MYYRQLSAGIKMENYKIITNFVKSVGPEAWANKTGINLMIIVLIFLENCL